MSAVPYRWIDRLEDLETFVQDLPARIAVDLEADSMYRYWERICLIQVSTPEENGIIDPLALPHLGPLQPTLEDPSVEKIFHGADYDVRLLKQAAGVRPKGLFDTMVAAQLLGLSRVGLGDLIQEHFGIQLEKRYQKADWGKRPLPSEMIQYAIQDTCYLLPLMDALLEELKAKGRLAWAREEFEALCRVEPTVRPSPDASRVRGAHSLDGRGRAVLQALLMWRDEEARRVNTPPYKIIGSSSLMEMATRCPSSLAEMKGIQGITVKVLQAWGDGLMKAMQRGLQAPPLALTSRTPRRTSKKRPGTNQRLRRLKKIRDERARELELDPGILCPNASLKSLAGAWPEDLEQKMQETLKTWQREALEEDLKKILEERTRERGPLIG